MTEQATETKPDAKALFEEARLSIQEMPTMAEGAAAIERGIEALKSFGFSINEATNVAQAPQILNQMGEFVEGLVNKIPVSLPESISEEQANELAEQLQKPFAAVSAFKEAVSGQSIENAQVRTGTEITAEAIVQGYNKLENGYFEFTLPEGLKVPKGESAISVAGKILNAAAKEKGIGRVFDERDAEFWLKNEKSSELQTVLGKKYTSRINLDSVGKNRATQEKDHDTGAPNGAIVLAEACERFKTGNDGSSLFKDAAGNKLWVRGSASGVALCSYSARGAGVYGCSDGNGDLNVAFASLASSRN